MNSCARLLPGKPNCCAANLSISKGDSQTMIRSRVPRLREAAVQPSVITVECNVLCVTVCVVPAARRCCPHRHQHECVSNALLCGAMMVMMSLQGRVSSEFHCHLTESPSDAQTDSNCNVGVHNCVRCEDLGWWMWYLSFCFQLLWLI